MRKLITTKEMATMFGKVHRDVVRSVNTVISSIDDKQITDAIFGDGFHIVRGNKYKHFEMNLDGFLLLTDTASFSRGQSAAVKASIIAEFGGSCAVISSLRTRFEDDFSRMLKQFFSKHEIKREVPIGGFRVDFLFAGTSLVVEYDEEYHLPKSQKEIDSKRDEILLSEFEITTVRVAKGKEVEGLAVIAGTLSILCGAEEITRYGESN